MWGLPGPGLEPVSPALAGGFLTTAPPGKPAKYILIAADSFADYGYPLAVSLHSTYFFHWSSYGIPQSRAVLNGPA